MIRFDAGLATTAIRNLSNHVVMLMGMESQGKGGDLVSNYPGLGTKVTDALLQADASIPLVPLSQNASTKINSLAIKISMNSYLTVSQLEVLLRGLVDEIIREIDNAYLLVFSGSSIQFLVQDEPLFGQSVHQYFPEARRDIVSAGRCWSLGEGTAAVFHLMRVLEIGLKQFAIFLGVERDSVDYTNWKNIIDQIEKRIRDIEQETKAADKILRLRKYSQIAANFFYIKEAWRNHTSHSRAFYDEDGALEVFNHTKLFMQRLAETLSDEQAAS